MNIIIDPELRDLLPPLTLDEYERLEASVLKSGIQDQIKVWEKDKESGDYFIVDGHNRFNISQKHKIEIRDWNICVINKELYPEKNDVIKYMIETQLGRRNLDTVEKFEIFQKHKTLFEEIGKQNMSSGGKGSTIMSKVDTRKEMAKLVGTSEGTYSKLDKIFSSDNEDVKKRVKSKEISINKGFHEIDKPKVSEKVKQKREQINSTSDCDMIINELDIKQKQIEEERKNIYLLRQQIFNNTPDDDLRCEVEEIKTDELWTVNYLFKFYLIKANNKIFVREMHDYSFEDQEHFDSFIEVIKDNCKFDKFSEKDIAVILSKIYETQKSFIEKAQERNADERAKQRAWQDRFIGKRSVKIQVNEIPFVKDIINAGYKELAKKFHPDKTNDNGEQMKLINEAKEILDKLIK